MISVVIPVYNQLKQLEKCLECFENQKVNEKYELIIVDDCSDIRYNNLINKCEQTNFRINLIRNQKNKGRSYSRNRGIDMCTGEIVVFCDADRYPQEYFLHYHFQNLKSIKSTKAVSIGCVMEDLSKNPYDKASPQVFRMATYYNVINNLFNEEGITNSKIPWIATLSGNMAIKGLNQQMMFDETFSEWGFEHFEFGYRMNSAGFVFTLCRKAINCHIAHRRDTNFYLNSIPQSLIIFDQKHSEFEIELFEKFILGKISLQDFEKSMGNEAWWCQKDIAPVYNRLISF